MTDNPRKETDLDILALGIRFDNELGHVSVRTQGFTHFLITCFQTPFICLTANGKEIGKEGDCIVFEPGFPQWHTHLPDAKQGFMNDWVHVSAEGLSELLEPFDIPFNTIIPSGNPGLITSDLTGISNELRQNLPLSQLAIRHHLESILLRIHRTVHRQKTMASYTALEAEYYPRFSRLREQVAGRLTEDWTVARMAGMVNLSTNRFSVLYKKFFANSPIDDLLAARIDLAKQHLLLSNATVEDIATRCGFANIHYFSKVFKQRVGVPPSKYS